MHRLTRVTSIALITLVLLIGRVQIATAIDNSATPSIQEWLAQAPSDYFAAELDQIRLKMVAGDYASALKALPQTLSKRAARADRSYLLQGLCQYATGDYKSAIASFRLSLQTKPSNSDTLFFLALSQQAAGLAEPALQSIEESLWFAKHNWVKADRVQYERGLLLSLKPDAAKAIDALTQAIKLNPQLTPARILLARLQQDSGNRAEAIRLLREGTSLQSNDSDLRLELAKALINGADRKINRTDIEESVKLTQEAFNSAGESAASKDAHLAYIRALIAAGTLDSAADKVALAAKRFPGDQDVETLRKQLAIEKDAQAVAAAKLTPTPSA